ncbi:MAG TPA: proline--tRNA ligase [Bacilli bacterium]|nr:MAG: Proline--tRNA ligase [Tenericutes bacterium ADurb.BinA124]HNZ50201.1 proline--tRNA ligase [Bacilli bacterium]HOH18048.1 proline--tRNA ligase [Bacilli bacterium]HPX83784.1 proline--tRNA ligase [Bacilli bacterium]HQC73913.1 proline--tRNA ligase [Bacilli bacterium]
MKQSLLFVPTLRETPKEAEVISHRILLKGGYIKQTAAGIYSYLPLAYRVIKKIEAIIREEMDAMGACELLMPALQPKDLWLESGRWQDYGKELVRLKDRHDRDFCLGPTHEEVVTAIVRDYINSYKKLPLALYQIQTKFRDEFRPRFGLMRGREFIMKDLYTFHSTDADLDLWYDKTRQAYQNILNRLDLHYRIVNASSGNIGGASSEEFMILCDIGEDTIVYSDESDFASNTELCDLPVGALSPDGKGHILHAKGIEAGHIFKLGTKYSEPMKAFFLDQNQTQQPIIMGCYGMGVSRLLMAVLEQHYRDEVALWPDTIAPFKIHIIPLDKEGTKAYQLSEQLHDALSNRYEVLFDDRDERPGVKFKDADLIGANYRLVCGRKAQQGLFEVTNLREKTMVEMSFEQLLEFLF